MWCDEKERCPKESEADAHCPFGLNLRDDPSSDGSMLHLYKKSQHNGFDQNYLEKYTICQAHHLILREPILEENYSAPKGEKPTRTEPYEVPAYEDGEIEHSMCSCVQHHIVRTQSFLQTDFPLLPVNIQNAEGRTVVLLRLKQDWGLRSDLFWKGEGVCGGDFCGDLIYLLTYFFYSMK